jgi:hypothetical protein
MPRLVASLHDPPYRNDVRYAIAVLEIYARMYDECKIAKFDLKADDVGFDERVRMYMIDCGRARPVADSDALHARYNHVNAMADTLEDSLFGRVYPSAGSERESFHVALAAWLEEL